MAKVHKMKRNTFFSAIITGISFLYKLGLGIFTQSLVLIIASFSTLMLFICKVVFVRNVAGTREKKKKAYFIMGISAAIYSLIFILFVVLKVNGIDISNKNTYEGLFGLLFIAFILLMFVLSIINLKGALAKDDIVVIGLKEMTFISALTDVVIIETFICRMILYYYDLDIIYTLEAYFPLGVAILITIISIRMISKAIQYEA